MSSRNKKLNRRQALGYGVGGFFGAQVGMNALNLMGSLLPKHGPLDRIRRIISAGDLDQLALAAEAPKVNIINAVVIDKFCHYLLRPYTDATNLVNYNFQAGTVTYDGRDLADTTINVSAFRNMGLGRLFGDELENKLTNPDFNICIIPQGDSQSGGHSLQNLNAGMENGGINYLAEKNSETGLLGAIGFRLRGDANSSEEGFQAPGGTPMETYESVDQVRNVLRSSVNAIAEVNSKRFSLRSKFDKLALKDTKSAAILDQIRQSVEPAMQPLLAALTENNAVRQQTAAMIALSKSGLAGNFMYVIPHDDTNGGGNHINGGGQFRLSPVISHTMLAESIAQVGNEIGNNSLLCISSDGGRSQNGGDSAGMPFIIAGHKSLVNNGVFGSWPGVAQLGQTNNVATYQDIQMSNGTTLKTLQHRHIYALMMKIAYDKDIGVPYPISIGGQKLSPKV